MITTGDLKKVLDENTDYAFDTIYFRCASLVDELLMYKIARKEITIDDMPKVRNRYNENFYRALEKIIQPPHLRTTEQYGGC